jgi:hypothetical protein
MKRGSLLVLALTLVTSWADGYADSYRVTVTRKGANLYKVLGKDILIVTRFCYEYVYYADAILKMSGYTGEIVFVDEEETCRVKAVYGKADVDPGTYKVTVSRESDDWYSIFGTDLFLRTSMCLSLALAEEAVLDLQPGGMGTLHLADSRQCFVEGVYTRLRL